MSIKDKFLFRSQKQLDAFLESDKKLIFPYSYLPETSIIIVTHNQTPLLFMCLLSLLRWADKCVYEVIIYNNGDSRENQDLLGRLENVTLISSETNVGFVKGVNEGAKVASGEFLLLLNDDAMLTYMCLENLQGRIKDWNKNRIGVVGAQVLSLGSTIQDAGGILWNDGTAAEYSKGRNPEIGDVNFEREVNYVSGACFMTPRELFLGMEGFDEEYSPGYCEESDYCLRLQKKGYKIIYYPPARVLHYEYGSSNTSQVNRLVEEHTKLLLSKHQDLLSAGYHSSTPVAYARSTQRYRGRVLIIGDFVPHVYFGYSNLLDFIQSLVDNNFFVTYFPLFSGVDDWNSVYQSIPNTVEVLLYESIIELPKFLAERPRYYDYCVAKGYDLSAIVSTTSVFDGKYVIQLGPEEDFDSPRLKDITKRTALWVDWHIPEYDTNAGDYAVYSYCNVFQKLGFKIKFWSDDPKWEKQSSKYYSDIVAHGWDIWNSELSFEQTLADLGHMIDLVILARPLSANYIQAVRTWTTAPIIYYCHDLHYLREERRLKQQGNLQQDDIEKNNDLKNLEHQIIKSTDLLVTVSQFEREEIKKELPTAAISVWPWYCPPKKVRARRQQEVRNIEFLGGLQHTPNLDAISWFLNDIYPIIRKEFPRPRFNIIGSYIPPEIAKLHDGDFIFVRGFKENLSVDFSMATVFVAPIRFGAGFKGKIAMAMSYGLPVVTTSLGAEGMGLTHGENVLIADTSYTFAKAVLQLITDEKLWQKLADNSYEFAGKHWSSESVKEQLRQDIKDLTFAEISHGPKVI